MKLQIETKSIVEIEVEFPLYKYHGLSKYKLTADKNAVEVCIDPDDCAIRIGKLPYWEIVVRDGKDITEQEYHEAFINVFEKIKQQSPVAEVV